MRARRPFVAALLALGLVGALSACDAVQGASNAANEAGAAIDKVKLCTDAIALAGFSPSTTDPQKALDETRAKADELNKLAEKAGDATLRDAINGVSDTMSSVTLSDFDPAKLAAWSQKKLDQAAKLTAACG